VAKEKVVEYPFPTRYGSHASMVVSEETEKLGDPTVLSKLENLTLKVR